MWQIDITHVLEFGKFGYVHVTVNIYSHVVIAKVRTGEAVNDVIQHLITCFSSLGVPKRIKTDNAPAYTSQAFAKLCIQWGIEPTIGIPYNPQCQTIRERTLQNLVQLQRLKSSGHYYSLSQLLSHALFTINHHNADDKGFTPMQKHWAPLQQTFTLLMMCKDLLTDT